MNVILFTIFHLEALIASFVLIRKYKGQEKRKRAREKLRAKITLSKQSMGIFATSTFEKFRIQTNRFIQKLSEDYLNLPTPKNEKIASQPLPI